MASKVVVNLDTSKENYLVAKCKQNDDLILEASIFENGEALNLTNKTITLNGLKSNNTYIIQNTNITKDNNKITVNLDRDFTRVSGTTKIEVVLVESGKQNTTFSFYLEVVNSVIKGAVESSNTVTILEALENKIVEAGTVKEETEQLITSGGAATKGDIQAVNASLEQKAQKTQADNIQQQVNNLVLGAVGDGNNAEVIQARGEYPLLNERISEIDYKSSNLVKKTNQLYDRSSCENGKIIGSDGVITDNADYKISGFIKALPSTIYSGTILGSDKIGFVSACLYNENKVFITRLALSSGTVTTTSTTKYIRLNVGKNESNAMFNEGNTLLGYEPYGFYTLSYKKEEVDEKFSNLYKYEDNLSFIETSKNLYNCDDINNVKGYVISSDGTITSNNQYEISDFIMLEPNTQYTGNSVANNGFHSIVLYNENKEFIKRTSISSEVNTITTTSNTKYGRLNAVNGSKLGMFNKGDTLLEFETYGKQLDYSLVKTQVEKGIDLKLSENIPSTIKKFLYCNQINERYELPTYTYNNALTMDYNAIYSAYDSLVTQYPNYVTKEVLGNDTSNTYPINCYKFTQKSHIVASGTIDQKPPTLILTTGIHGSEKPSILALLNLMDNICKKWTTNKALEKLRWNVNFVILPIVNPWGYENNRRGNVNNVDINRNFDYNWLGGSSDNTSDNYRGTAPHSEKETQYCVDIMNRYKDETLCLIDFHSLGSGDTSWDLLFRSEIPTTMEQSPFIQICTNALNETTISGVKNYSIPDTTFLGKINSNTNALIGNYAQKIGIKAFCNECAYMFVGGEQYADNINKFNIEYITNTIINTINVLLN